MLNSKFISSSIIFILLAGNLFFGYNYFSDRAELRRAKDRLLAEELNKEALEFTKLFISRVLKSQSEVDFETRLKLENMVRELKDEKILAQWQKFTESGTEAAAQTEVKNLLEMLINKISLE